MPRHVFDAIKTSPTKKGVCSKCGKRRQRTKVFMETVNPFNKNADGTQKTRKQVEQSVIAKTSAWLKEPLICASCDD